MCTSGTFHAHISMVHVPVEAVTRKVWPAQVGHGTATESPRTPKLTSAFLPPLHSQTDVMILFSQIVKLKNLWISSNSLPCQNLKCFHTHTAHTAHASRCPTAQPASPHPALLFTRLTFTKRKWTQKSQLKKSKPLLSTVSFKSRSFLCAEHGVRVTPSSPWM